MSIEKLDFTKVAKENLPYTVFLNSVIQNISNPEALAIYVYLYSLPPDWLINKEHLCNKFKLGDKKLRSIFSYFHRANLIRYDKEKDQKTGKMIGTTLHLLNGENFYLEVPFKEISTTQAIFASVEKTTQAISDPVENRPCGLEGLQKKHKNKRNKKTTNKTAVVVFSENENQEPHLKQTEETKKVDKFMKNMFHKKVPR